MSLVASSGREFQAYKWTWGVVAAVVQSTVYFAIGHVPLSRSPDLLRTRFDDAIPFLPVTAWLYLPVYAAIFIIALAGFRSRCNFNRALRAFAFIMVVGLLGHLLIGAVYPRPLLKPPFADLSSRFLAWVQSIDPPGNVFPSLHVAHTASLAFFIHRDNPRLGRLVMVLALLLAASTLTTKQHFIADVLSGFALAALACWLILRGSPPFRHDSPRKPGLDQ